MMKYHLYNYNCLETRFYYLFGDGYNGWKKKVQYSHMSGI